VEKFSPWARVDFIAESPPAPPRKADPGATEDFEMRYRLPDPHRPVPHIEFEVRVPAGTRLPDDFHVLYTGQRRDDREDQGSFLHDNWRRLDGDRPVLMGGMAIGNPTKHPKITLKLLDGPMLVFDLEFPATPTTSFGPWKPAQALEEFGKPPRPPGPNDGVELRYRIDAPR
jgi:hypothetical protein